LVEQQGVASCHCSERGSCIHFHNVNLRRHEWSAEAVRPRVGLYTRGRFTGCVLEHVPFERDPFPLDKLVTLSSPIERTRPFWSGIPARLLWLWRVHHSTLGQRAILCQIGNREGGHPIMNAPLFLSPLLPRHYSPESPLPSCWLA